MASPLGSSLSPLCANIGNPQRVHAPHAARAPILFLPLAAVDFISTRAHSGALSLFSGSITYSASLSRALRVCNFFSAKAQVSLCACSESNVPVCRQMVVLQSSSDIDYVRRIVGHRFVLYWHGCRFRRTSINRSSLKYETVQSPHFAGAQPFSFLDQGPPHWIPS